MSMVLRGVAQGWDEAFNGSLHQVMVSGQAAYLLREDDPGGAMREAYAREMAAWRDARDDLHELRWRPFSSYTAYCIQDAGALEARFQFGNATTPQYRFYVASLDGRLRSAVVRNQTAQDSYTVTFAYGSLRMQVDPAAQRTPGRLDVLEAPGGQFQAGLNTTRMLWERLRLQVMEEEQVVNDTRLAPGTVQVAGGQVSFWDQDGDGRLGPGDRFAVQLPEGRWLRVLDSWAMAPLRP
jgi:hypothetical protein